jgi:hypothetical protein
MLYVGDIHSQRGYVLRWQTYRNWVEENGMEAQHTTVRSFDDDYELYEPTAIVVSIDEDCGPVYRALHRKGVAILDDCDLEEHSSVIFSGTFKNRYGHRRIGLLPLFITSRNNYDFYNVLLRLSSSAISRTARMLSCKPSLHIQYAFPKCRQSPVY